MTDKFNLKKIIEMLDSFINYTKTLHEINKSLTNKKIRLPNFPSEISENIVKLAIQKKYNVCPNWDTISGDLELNGKKIEVKGYSSNGPASFGPTENWDTIYFINCKDFLNKNFIVTEVNLSNKDDTFNLIKVNEKQTYKDQCNQGKRPRIAFDKLQKQLPEESHKVIFDGNLDQLS